MVCLTALGDEISFALNELADAKVGKLEATRLLAHQQVLGLDIAVQHVVVVKVLWHVRQQRKGFTR